MIQYHVYPGGCKRIVTFSYDDGHKNDIKLIELFNKYHLKATFHINGSKFKDMSTEEKNKTKNLYSGHEISCHTLQHGWPARMPGQSIVNETMEDRLILESIAGYPVVGMSYPSGSYNTESVNAMKACGIVYSRTCKSTNNFNIPENFMEWHPSCHHKNAEPLIEKFLMNIDSIWTHPLFYIWGHSHELNNESDWNMMENICIKLANNKKIWYATNIEIYNYMQAQKMLLISADENIIYNPTNTNIWLEKDNEQIIEVPAGKTLYL